MTAAIRSFSRVPVVAIVASAILLLLDDVLPASRFVDRGLAAILLMLIMVAAASVMVAGPEEAFDHFRTTWPRLTVGAGVSLISLALALFAVELGTRWIYRDITTTSDHRGFFAEHWRRASVQLNALGFRDRPRNPGKANGVYRIAVVGDSFTYGNGIEANHRFTELVERALGPGFEVLNFGLPGNNTPEEARVIQSTVRGFAPDFILVQWFVNDVEGGAAARPDYSTLLPSTLLHEWLLPRSALYTVSNSWWTRRQTLGLGAGSYADYLRSQQFDPQSLAALSSVSALRRLAGAASDLGATLGFVLFPDAGYDLGNGYPFVYLHDRVMAFCRDTSLTCLDLRPDFAQVRRRESLWANRMDAHPSVQANAIAASRILQTFEPIWLTRYR